LFPLPLGEGQGEGSVPSMRRGLDVEAERGLDVEAEALTPTLSPRGEGAMQIRRSAAARRSPEWR